MYVRLAFAVAAHLEPEILVVDEVLAVGDAEFQQKCLGKMHDVATGGRTVLFVSHNMQAISTLCTRALFLNGSSIAYAGTVKEAIDLYLASFSRSGGSHQPPDRRPGSGDYRFTLAYPEREYFGGNDQKSIVFEIQRRRQRVGRMWLSAHIVDSGGAVVAQCDSRLVGTWLDDFERLAGCFRFRTPWLKPGSYRVDLYISSPGLAVDQFEGACLLTISPVIPYPSSASEDAIRSGLVFADFAWETCDDSTGPEKSGEPLTNITRMPNISKSLQLDVIE
jgi:lipopolysaccharide transport system ATP-binding protein